MNYEPFDGGMGMLGRLTHAEEAPPFSFLGLKPMGTQTGYNMNISRGSKVPEKA